MARAALSPRLGRIARREDRPRALLTGFVVVATVTLLVFFYLTTILLSFVYDMDQALLAF